MTIKLTEKQVREIFLSPKLQMDLAEQYSISATVVHGIKSRRYWTHVTRDLGEPGRPAEPGPRGRRPGTTRSIGKEHYRFVVTCEDKEVAADLAFFFMQTDGIDVSLDKIPVVETVEESEPDGEPELEMRSEFRQHHKKRKFKAHAPLPELITNFVRNNPGCNFQNIGEYIATIRGPDGQSGFSQFSYVNGIQRAIGSGRIRKGTDGYYSTEPPVNGGAPK